MRDFLAVTGNRCVVYLPVSICLPHTVHLPRPDIMYSTSNGMAELVIIVLLGQFKTQGKDKHIRLHIGSCDDDEC